jgi:DNA-binding transcriptional ArsR family regulator
LQLFSYVDISRRMDMISAIEGLSALAQPTRLRVFRSLVKAGDRGLPAGDIAQAEAVPHNTMSTHLSILARAGLVQSKRNGRSVIYTVDLDGIRNLLSYLVSDCCDGHPEICAPLIEVAERSCCPPRKTRRASSPRPAPSRQARQSRQSARR